MAIMPLHQAWDLSAARIYSGQQETITFILDKQRCQRKWKTTATITINAAPRQTIQGSGFPRRRESRLLVTRILHRDWHIMGCHTRYHRRFSLRFHSFLQLHFHLPVIALSRNANAPRRRNPTSSAQQLLSAAAPLLSYLYLKSSTHECTVCLLRVKCYHLRGHLRTRLYGILRSNSKGVYKS